MSDNIASITSKDLLISIGIGIGVTAAVTALGGWYLIRDEWPLKWRRVGTLEHINLSPIESCAPLTISKDAVIKCHKLGLIMNCVRDCSFMVVDFNNKVITAQDYPHMVLIQPKLIAFKKLLITYKNVEPLELDMNEIDSHFRAKNKHICYMHSKLDFELCGEKYDKWFSKVILDKDNGLRLIYYPFQKLEARNAEMFYILMNSASIDELKTHDPNKVDPLPCLSNFYIKMDNPEAYAEGNWKWVKIGKYNVFHTFIKSINWAKNQTVVCGIYLRLQRSDKPVQFNDVVYVEDE